MTGKTLGDPQEIVLREYGQLRGEQVQVFQGWQLTRVLGDVGLANEVPQCVIYLTTDGKIVVALGDVLPEEDLEPGGIEFPLIGVVTTWEEAHDWGLGNAPVRWVFQKAWSEARAAVGEKD